MKPASENAEDSVAGFVLTYRPMRQKQRDRDRLEGVLNGPVSADVTKRPNVILLDLTKMIRLPFDPKQQ